MNFIEELIKKKNWPLYSDVGKEAGDAAFLIVQHSGNNHLTKKALKLLEIAVKNNEASKQSYAMMLDRYRIHKNKKQIYGTQVVKSTLGKNDDTGNLIWSEYMIYPIENQMEVNKRRKEMGMNTVEENVKRWNITEVYFPNGENMSFRKQLKLQKSKLKPINK